MGQEQNRKHRPRERHVTKSSTDEGSEKPAIINGNVHGLDFPQIGIISSVLTEKISRKKFFNKYKIIAKCNFKKS